MPAPLLLAALLAGNPAAGNPEPAAAPPNLLVILADDLGYGDLSCYGATAVRTPHVDALAAGGVRFTAGYASASTCTPTRYSLLTGRYAFRGDRTGIAPPDAPAIIAPGTPTLPGLLNGAGYATGVVGKWHLGLGGPGGPDWNGTLSPGPLEVGFDRAFLLPTTNDRVPQVFVGGRRVLNLDPADPLWVGREKPSPDHPTGLTHRDGLKMDWSHGHNGTIHNGVSRIGFYTGGHAARFRDEDLADRWVAESVGFLEANRDRPWFLLFSSHDLHVPRLPHERFAGASDLGPRGDSIVQLDWCVGELTAALDRLGLRENTLILFCSDNGPVLDDGYEDGAMTRNDAHRAAGPFAGGKYSVYEGGTRTPFVTNWPGRIAPGVSDAVVSTIDLPASLCAVAGVPVPPGACPDSVDVSAALLGEPGAAGRTELVTQNNGGGGVFGFRSGRWKLVRHDNGKANHPRVEDGLTRTAVPRLQLFDLDADPGETTDVAAGRPAVLERLERRLAEIVAPAGS